MNWDQLISKAIHQAHSRSVEAREAFVQQQLERQPVETQGDGFVHLLGGVAEWLPARHPQTQTITSQASTYTPTQPAMLQVERGAKTLAYHPPTLLEAA